MISGKPTIIKEYNISFNGSIQEKETMIFNAPSSDGNRYADENLLEDLPSLLNCSRHSLGNFLINKIIQYTFIYLAKNIYFRLRYGLMLKNRDVGLGWGVNF